MWIIVHKLNNEDYYWDGRGWRPYSADAHKYHYYADAKNVADTLNIVEGTIEVVRK